MSESERKSVEQLLQQAKNIYRTKKISSIQLKNKLNFISRQIENYSSFLVCGFCSSSQKYKVQQGFKRAFKKLTLNEKVIYFWRMCTSIKKYQSNQNNDQQLIPQKGQKEMLDTTIYLKQKKQYQNWTVTRIKASLINRKINITDKSIVLDMHDYLVRTVKNKQKQKSFAIQSTSMNQTYRTIRFCNQGTSYEQLYNFFKKIQKQAIKDQIRSILCQGKSQKERNLIKKNIKSINNTNKPDNQMIQQTKSLNSVPSLNNKFMTLKLVSSNYALTPKNIIEKQMIERTCILKLKDQSFNQIHKVLLPQKLLQNLQNFNNFQKIRQFQNMTLYYHKRQAIIRKKYKFQSKQNVILDWLVDQLNNFPNFSKWKKNLIKINCLNTFPSQKTKIFYQIYDQNSKKINYLYIRHYFNLINSNRNSQNKKVHYYYDQSISQPICKNYFGISQNIAQISYIIWKFYQTQNAIQLLVEAKCNHIQNKVQNMKMTEIYLGEFEKILIHPKTMRNISQDSQIHLNTIMFENQYLDQINDLEDIDNDTQYFTICDKDQKISIRTNKKVENQSVRSKNNISMTIRQEVSFIDNNSKNTLNYLKFKHPKVPYLKGKSVYKTPKTGNHPQWQTQWKINQKGQLININKQKIDAQNNVLKSVFKTLGRNLITGKSILSISLPVEVFGDDSNLSRLCNSYGYAPIFLQAAAQSRDPLQKLKNVIAFGMTATVNYLRMDKPFNPILGQTYQSLIDGCPIYGEQISHHPPISAVFMKGRGYTVYGHLQAKVQLSLNSANGINQGQISICFDNQNLNKNKIRYSNPPGQLTGVLYGDRRMCMIKKSYYVDQQNGLYCQVNWGKHKGKKDSTNKFYDSVQAQIVKLKSGIDLKKVKTIKKSDIEKQIGLVHGRWTGAVYYNDNLIFDTYQTFPHLVQQYIPNLQSDVSKRKDLNLRRAQTNLQRAQQAKQELQQIQRKDRKLRAQYNPNSQKH